MPGLVPGIHVFTIGNEKGVDGRDKPGHDEGEGGRVTLAAAAIEQDTFAANRARGRIALAVAAADGVTRRTRVHEAGSLRVRFPNTQAGLEAVIVNTGGGMTGGDDFTVDIDLGAGARLVAGTAAAEKIYRSTGADTSVSVHLAIGEGARLAWLPQETILFDRARLKRRIDIEIAEDASLVMAEAVLFGRAAMDETMREGVFADTWRLRRGGRLVFAENVRLDGDIAGKLARPASAAGGIALATVLIAPAGDTTLDAARSLNFAGEAGISAWNGIAVARLVAPDGAALRRDLVAILAALGQGVPRLWYQ
jgi:urease accessory protein